MKASLTCDFFSFADKEHTANSDAEEVSSTSRNEPVEEPKADEAASQDDLVDIKVLCDKIEATTTSLEDDDLVIIS